MPAEPARPNPEAADPDDELIRQARQGDAAAFRRLTDRHADALYRLARSLSLSDADAEDVVQETLLGLYRGMRGFGGRSRVRTWLVRILIRQATKAWRRDKSRRARAVDAGVVLRILDERQRRAETRHGNGELATPDVMATIRSLTGVHREVLLMKELNGLTPDQIARRLNVPRGTVDSRLSRARAELREKLLRRGWRPQSAGRPSPSPGAGGRGRSRHPGDDSAAIG